MSALVFEVLATRPDSKEVWDALVGYGGLEVVWGGVKYFVKIRSPEEVRIRIAFTEKQLAERLRQGL